MKKLFALMVLIGVISVSLVLAVDSLTNFTISSPTTTTLYASWTNGLTASMYDTLSIVGSDSLCYKVLSALTATSGTVTGLKPHTLYKWYVRGHLQAGGYRVSNWDTLYTAYPQIETPEWQRSEQQMMFGARSWIPAGITYDSLYCGDSTGLDSTMVYVPWKYTAIQLKAIGHADSCKVLVRVFPGFAEETNVKRETTSTNTGKWEFKKVAIDSINITQAGWTLPKLLAIPTSSFFYISVDGQTGNGHETKLISRLYRNKD